MDVSIYRVNWKALVSVAVADANTSRESLDLVRMGQGVHCGEADSTLKVLL